MKSEALKFMMIGIDSMTANDLLDDSKVYIPIEEYRELIKARNENKQLKEQIEKYNRENFGLKTTVKNLQRCLYRQKGYR